MIKPLWQRNYTFSINSLKTSRHFCVQYADTLGTNWMMPYLNMNARWFRSCMILDILHIFNAFITKTVFSVIFSNQTIHTPGGYTEKWKPRHTAFTVIHSSKFLKHKCSDFLFHVTSQSWKCFKQIKLRTVSPYLSQSLLFLKRLVHTNRLVL